MNLRSKLFAESVLVPEYPLVSRRLLADLAQRAVHDAADAVEHPELRARSLVGEHFGDLTRLSAPFLRQAMSGGSAPDAELIYLVRDSDVGPRTTLRRLARLLKNGIESGDSDFRVRIEKCDELNPRLKAGGDEIAVLLVYRRGKKDATEGTLASVRASLAGDSPVKLGVGEHDPPPRVVYVCAAERPAKAQQWASKLLPDVLIWDGEAHMCSLIPTIIKPKVPRDEPRFRVEPIYERQNLRFHRDKSVLLAEAGHDNELPEHPPGEEIERWARNVMNKQVGIASSGGGASAYRIVALIEAMHATGIPIDIFSGLSGGSVMGAYFAGGGLRGLDQVVERGETLACLLPRLFFSTRGLERLIDEDLGYQRLGNTSMKFHAVTTELHKDIPPGTPPNGAVVVEATLGQAARAASALPVGFAPTTLKGNRYADGMASTIVPTQVVADHGADIVLACNCVPGPKQTNPFSAYWLGRFLYDRTMFGRVIDAWTWIDYLTQTASTAEGFGSTTYFEFKPKSQAALEMWRWGDSYQIVDSARQESERIDAAMQRMKAAWNSVPWGEI